MIYYSMVEGELGGPGGGMSLGLWDAGLERQVEETHSTFCKETITASPNSAY